MSSRSKSKNANKQTKQGKVSHANSRTREEAAERRKEQQEEEKEREGEEMTKGDAE